MAGTWNMGPECFRKRTESRTFTPPKETHTVMISKNRIRLIRSLEHKKFRKENRLFVAEGPKVVECLMPAFACRYLAATPQWQERYATLWNALQAQGVEHDSVSREELERASLLRSPQEVIALFQLPQEVLPPPQAAAQELCLALDGVQDPGNLGTIVRVADWFGITHLYCSPDTADLYNPKVVQATMGALARVQVHYVDLPAWLDSLPQDTPVYGTFLDGDHIYGQTLARQGVIVMGNEGKGIGREVAQRVNSRLYIPNYPEGQSTSESLNVAIATAVVCAEFRRQHRV